MLKTKKTVTE